VKIRAGAGRGGLGLTELYAWQVTQVPGRPQQRYQVSAQQDEGDLLATQPVTALGAASSRRWPGHVWLDPGTYRRPGAGDSRRAWAGRQQHPGSGLRYSSFKDMRL